MLFSSHAMLICPLMGRVLQTQVSRYTLSFCIAWTPPLFVQTGVLRVSGGFSALSPTFTFQDSTIDSRMFRTFTRSFHFNINCFFSILCHGLFQSKVVRGSKGWSGRMPLDLPALCPLPALAALGVALRQIKGSCGMFIVGFLTL